MRLLFKKLRENAVIPKYQTEYSAGLDLCACVDGEISIPAGDTVKVPTGLAAELEGEKNAVLLIYARSSLATKLGLAPANCVGVVDWDYRGELIVALHNASAEDRVIQNGDRIAQLVVTPIYRPEVCEAEELSDTARGAGGFGSTGLRNS